MKRSMLTGAIVGAMLWTLLFVTTGCTSDPVGQAAELRALHKEAQAQVAEMKTDPAISPKKIAELEERLEQIGPFISAIEIAAAQARNDPGKWINFHQLWLEYRPKIQSLLIAIVLRRYLGA